MTEFEETGLDPETIYIEGQNDLQAQLEERMQNEFNMIPGEVQALFDPAPRRGKGRKGKRCGTAKQHAKMPQMFPTVCASGKSPRKAGRGKKQSARRYDPAPVRQNVTRYVTVTKEKVRKGTKKAKSAGTKLFNKLEPYIPVGVGIGALYSLYNTHLTELKAAGKLNKDGTPVASIIDAVMYDINNWSTVGNGMTGASTRLQEHWKEILSGVLGGLVVQEGTKGTKYSRTGKVAGRSLMAIGGAYAIKAILDPPVQAGNPVRQVSQSVQRVQTQYQSAQTTQSTAIQSAGRVRGNVQFTPTVPVPVIQNAVYKNIY